MTKYFQIRDEATTISAIAIWFSNLNDKERKIVARVGYRPPESYIYFINLEDYTATYDPFVWKSRTMHIAHSYIRDNWDKLISGQVIDV